jgi:hypothetical protein
MRSSTMTWGLRRGMPAHSRWMALVPAALIALSGSVVLTASNRTVQAHAASTAPHVMVIVDENIAYNSSDGSPYIIGNTNAPYINNTLLNSKNPLATSATQWYSVEHVSDYDYFDLISGADQKGVFKPVGVGTKTFVDELAAQQISWKAYMENMPSTCYTGGETNNYVAGHNPFINFQSITKTPSQCNNVVPYQQSQMTGDLNAASPPSFVWITPNLCNDMHDSCAPTNNPVRQGDNWLASTIPAVQSTAWYRSGGIIILTWDESVTSDTSGVPGTSDSGGHIATLVISAANSSPYTAAGDHFGTLLGLEKAYGVSCLGASCKPGHGDISGAFAAAGSINGMVTDGTNRLPGVTVTCSVCTPTTTTTASDGSYTLASAPPTSDSVTFSDPGYAPQTDSVTVTAGKKAVLNVALVKDGSITGRVTDSNTSKAIAGATVTCSSCSPTTATTGTNGTYTLTNALPGTDAVTFSAPGYAPVTDPVTVNSSTPATQDQALTPQANGSITGTVTDSSTTAPIPSASVSCSVCSPTTTTTDSNGLYTLASAPPASDSVTFSASGYTPQTISVTVPAGQPAKLDAKLVPVSNLVFSDGFEAGLTAWTTSSGITTEGTTVHSGAAAAVGSPASAPAYVQKSLPSTYTAGYERVWFYLSSQSTQVFLLQADTTGNATVAIAYVNSKGFLGLQAADGSRHDSTTAVTTNTWHELELGFTVNGNAGSANLWLDAGANPVLSLSGLNLKTTPVGIIQVGDATSHTWAAFFDDAAFDTQFIP